MADAYGSDFITITDEDGTDYELEVLTSIEYNGGTYLAVIPADQTLAQDYQVSILRSTEEDGEPILTIVEDQAELDAVNSLIIDSLYSDDDTQ